MAVVVVGAVVAGMVFLSGDDDRPDVTATSIGVTTTLPPTTTATTQPSSTIVPASLTLAGLTPAAIVSAYPRQAADLGLPISCSDLTGFPAVSVQTDRLEAGESFVRGTFGSSGCDVELWGIMTPTGGLRELSLQVFDPTAASVDQMISAATALVTLVGDPMVDAAAALAHLDQTGWLGSSDITTHEGDAVIGDVKLGTFTTADTLVFFIIPAR